MTLQITWHLIAMIIITVFLLIGSLKESEGLDMTPIICMVILVVLWAIYGGIFIW